MRLRKTYIICILYIAMSSSLFAATRGDVKVIEASESIRYLSQKMVKDYLFSYTYPNDIEVKKSLKHTLSILSDQLRIIATTTKDTDTKDILEFLSYSKEQIKSLFEQKANKEKVGLMLDYSDTILEGINAIEKAHKYNFTEEEKMLMVTKDIQYLMERITKYYLALNSGINTTVQAENMKKAISKVDKNLEIIHAYHYTDNTSIEQKNLIVAWNINKYYFQKNKTLFIPNLLFESVDNMESIARKISLYHNKNQ